MKDKIKVFFDGNILVNDTEKNSGRSGIFVTSCNILRELVNNKKTDLKLFSLDSDFFNIMKIIGKDHGFLKKNVKLVDTNLLLEFLKYHRRRIRREVRKNKRTGLLGIYDNLVLNLLFSGIILNILVIAARILPKRKMEVKNSIFFYPLGKIYKGKIYDNINNINKNNKVFILVYDMIPFLFPELYQKIEEDKHWTHKSMNNITKDDYFFAISNNTKKDLIRLNKNVDENKVFVTHLAASDNFYCCKDKIKIANTLKKYNIPSDCKYILSLCTIEPRKNLPFAAKCFVKFVKENNIKDLYFVLVGGHWDEFIEQIEREIYKFDDFRNRIIRTGYVDDEDLAPLYSSAEFFVYPSLYEGFGLPPLEAMKCGTPVITSNTSSLPEVVGDAGIMIDPRNEEELISAFKKLYYDYDFRKFLSKKGLKRAKEFSWEKTVNTMVNRFEKVLRGEE